MPEAGTRSTARASYDGSAKRMKAPGRGRTVFVFSVALYTIVFVLTYRDLVVPLYEYMGFGYSQLPFQYLILMFTAAIIPAFQLPFELNRPSLFFMYLLYFLVYIPTVFMVFYCVRPVLDYKDAAALVVCLFIGLEVLLIAYRLPLHRLRRVSLRESDYWGLISCVVVLLFGVIVVFYWKNFRLANFIDIYEVRLGAAEIGTNSLVIAQYAPAWLGGVCLPLCVAYGIFTRRWWLLISAALVYVGMYGLFGSKSALLALLYFPAVWAWTRFPKRYAGLAFALGACGLLASGWLVKAIASPFVALWYVSLVHNRIFALGGLLTTQYYQFFMYNPLTYMSHVAGINVLIKYPYDTSVPYQVGRYIYSSGVDANANMWAYDGLAAFGLAGVIVISALSMGVFWMFDCLTSRHQCRFVVMLLPVIGMFLANCGLFTTLMTGGLGGLMILLWLMPNDGSLRRVFKPVRTPCVGRVTAKLHDAGPLR